MLSNWGGLHNIHGERLSQTGLDGVPSFERAAELYSEAVALLEAAGMTGDRRYGHALRGLGWTRYMLGDPVEAEKLYLKAAEEGLQGTVNSQSHTHLAFIYGTLKRPQEALEVLLKAAAADDELIAEAFAITSDRQRLEFATRCRGTLNVILSLALAWPEVISPRQAFDVVVRRKGIVVEAGVAQGRLAAMRHACRSSASVGYGTAAPSQADLGAP